ncbi:MAG: MarC family NAAT transporter [Lewinellaceae bacterium]|nr:MarC family NAAT transporter [Lewinella sp.]MCB9279187.1 MarC family NAAT transporter [Lewinellaceae bacterium]HMQ90705.1 MarC family NAAT transporter [Flavilitoribacter sp.]
MVELFFAVLAGLFSVVNPIGVVPVFLAMTPTYTKQERAKTARSTAIYFTLILIVFFVAGTYILGFFGVSLSAMRIAGGIIILLSGYSLLSGKQAEGRAYDKAVEDEALTKPDISFSPLAMPLLSGPGSISLLISLFSEHPDWIARGIIVSVIVINGLLVFLILRSAPYLFRVLGEAGMRALSRIMGFIVMAIGVQYIIVGIVKLVSDLHPH